jgi:hypothetical protein
MIFHPLAENHRAASMKVRNPMEQSKQPPASNQAQPATPSPAANERPRLRRSVAVREYITRMVAGMNNYKAKE